MRLVARVSTGKAEAAGFTQLDWVREQLIAAVGIDPYPGTLNLLAEHDHMNAWRALRSAPGVPLVPPTADWCSARCYAVRLDNRLPAAVVVPEVPGYPDEHVEIVAALHVRDTLGYTDGDRVEVELARPLRVKAVILDVDGTLVDSLEAFRIVAERACAPLGLTITPALVRHAMNTAGSFWDLALPADCPDRPATKANLSREAARLWPDVLREHCRAFPQSAAMLRALRARGAKLGIVTGSHRASLEPLRDCGVLGYFDSVVTAEDVRWRKPDPEGLLMCARALGVEAKDAVYVGDTPLDVEAGHRAGMFAVGVLTGAGDSALLSRAGADRLVSTADRLIETVALPND